MYSSGSNFDENGEMENMIKKYQEDDWLGHLDKEGFGQRNENAAYSQKEVSASNELDKDDEEEWNTLAMKLNKLNQK
jgi:hypothetical protein